MRRLALIALLAQPLLAQPARAEVPRVVTDIPPVQALTALVMGNLGTPALLLAPGADEHDFQLRPSQMQDISTAQLIILVDPALTPWLARAAESATAPQLALLHSEGTRLRQLPEGQHEDHADENADEHADEHDHSGTDPHAWLDPDNAALWTRAIAAELSRLDPENAATYAANAAAATADIAALDAEIAARLAPLAAAPFVTNHDAYGYFAAHYGLAYLGAVALGDATTPGAAHLAELQALIRDHHIQCLFPEAQHDPALISQLLTPGTRLGLALDPVGSTLDPGPQAYRALMTTLAANLAACLQG